MKPDEIKMRRARKVVDSGMNIPLAQLSESIYINDKLDVLISQESKEIEFPSEFSISNLPEIQKVEITNFLEKNDDTELLSKIDSLIEEVKKKEELQLDLSLSEEIKASLKGDDGIDGTNGIDGKDGVNGNNGSQETAQEIADRLNTLQEKISYNVIKGLPAFVETVSKSTYWTQKNSAAFSQPSKTLTYNGDGTLNMSSDATGTKTFGYTAGVLTSLDATGVYKNKSFVYSGGKLTNVNVS